MASDDIRRASGVSHYSNTDEMFPRDDYLVGDDDDFDALLRDGADFRDIRNRLLDPVTTELDEKRLALIEEQVTKRKLTDQPLIANLLLTSPTQENRGYRQHAVKCCAKQGWLNGLKFLRAHGVPILWAPMFASMRGHTHILEWIEKTTTYLESITVAMECTTYGVALGGNPKASLWLLEKQYIDPKYVVQCAIRKGDIPILSEVYSYLKDKIDVDFLREVLRDSFPYVWINAVGAPEKVQRTIEYMVSVSDLELEAEWHRQVFQHNKKRMRLAKVLGNWSAPSVVQEAFVRGMKLKLSGWCGKSDQDKHRFLEILMESKTETRLTHVADLVDSFLIGDPLERASFPCPVSPPELDHLESICG